MKVRRQRWPHEVKRRPIGHRVGGLSAIDFYTEWKPVYVDHSDRLQKAQIDRVDWTHSPPRTQRAPR
ncbi:MAG TPA: hypothetical protein VFE08_09775 [Candidatus Sulfotelmatobacter sp.]|nr:hypothetical protein [Candidatus Sulfotelmatobacter sp.]